MRTYCSVVGLLIMLAAPLCAQNEKDVAAYLGSVLSTPGAAATLAESPLLGDNTNAWGIAPFYTHVGLGDFGDLSAIGLDGSLSANVFGGTVYASGIGGRLALAVTGAYVNPSCPDGFDCEGFATVGGSGTARLLRASVATDSGARFTLSLRGAGGYAFAPGSDRYTSASLGVPLSLSAPEGSYRIVAFVTPGLVWGKIKTSIVDPDLGRIEFDESGTRAALSGGLAFVPSGSGVGIHAGFQRIFVDHAGTQFSVALSWNMPKLGDR